MIRVCIMCRVITALVLSLAIATLASAAGEPHGMANPEQSTPPTANSFSAEGIEQIKQNDKEIRALFIDIRETLERIDRKYSNLKKIMDDPAGQSMCMGVDSMLKDIANAQDNIAELERHKPLQSDEAIQLNELKTREQIYKKAYKAYSQKLHDRKLKGDLKCSDD